ncbi:MAG: anhydro-N-acetylmuramic acid kinase [Gallionellaceae bacterium]|nr:anhydro-N-acetylmuramic acid kinase [Gallionellaceae bacterium]
MDNSELYIGIMSGTSLDGIDVALVDFSDTTPKLIATHFQPYPDSLKATLLALHQPASNELHQAQITANQLATDYATATLALLQTNSVSAKNVRAIGCHGQTIRHRPELGYTVQLGNAALLAELTSIDVVSDFRSRDIAAHGQGAPLVPAFHDRVLRHPNIHRVIVNIGGISNLTNLAPNQPTIGFDCGPGNLLMDAWIYEHQGCAYDKNGAWASSGKAIPSLLEKLKSESFFRAPPPKSCGRDLFNLPWLKSQLHGDETPEDVQATLLALTVHGITDSIQRNCAGAEEVYLCGGGAYNGALMRSLKQSLPQCNIQLTDVLGIGANWLEAIAFAWLAQQTINGKSANLPEATGAKHPCILGAIYQK